MEENSKEQLLQQQKRLLQQRRLIEIQLESIRLQIECMEDIPSEDLGPITGIVVQGNTTTIPAANGSGKESTNPLKADALPKSMQRELDNPKTKMVNTTALKGKKVSSPVANGSGKDGSNPFIPVALGKSKGATSTTTNSLSVQELRPSYLTKALEPKKYYCVYLGPHAGIYTDWGIVSKILKEPPKQSSTKFSSLAAAEHSMNLNAATPVVQPKVKKERKHESSDDELITPELLARRTRGNPEGYIKGLKLIEQQKLDKARKAQWKFDTNIIRFNELFIQARRSGPEAQMHTTYVTEDKEKKSSYVFKKESDPSFVAEVFHYGLCSLIYPSDGLEELSEFPEPIVKAVKEFKKKKAPQTPIFLKIQSSYPDWGQGKNHPAIHQIKLGLSKAKPKLPVSRICEETLPFLVEERAQQFKTFVETLRQLGNKPKVKVNLMENNTLIYSDASIPAGNDRNMLEDWCIGIINNEQPSHLQTKLRWCELSKKTYAHACPHCPQDENMEGSTSNNSDQLYEKLKQEKESLFLLTPQHVENAFGSDADNIIEDSSLLNNSTIDVSPDVSEALEALYKETSTEEQDTIFREQEFPPLK